MPYYHKIGTIPHKRHTVFKDGSGNLIYEELIGTIGFDGMSSLVYHKNRPTQILTMKSEPKVPIAIAVENNLKPMQFSGFNLPSKGDFLSGRVPVLLNKDITISLAAPNTNADDYLYKNADEDELFFVHKGSGILKSIMGNISFSMGDYLLIPRGIVYQMNFTSTDNRLLIITSLQPIYTPHRYRNHFGQMLETAPFCERDIRKPQEPEIHDEKCDFLVKINKGGVIHNVTYATHPLDVVGWDGYYYPYAFNINDFEPITGRIHQPPPVHQTFETSAMVVCSFCPRLYDYHPDSIPAPYHHSNVDSDEVLYYVDGDFMSRNNVKPGNITLHPTGVTHGPHPGAIERSIGKKETQELAVMIDTFSPLKVTIQALELADETYINSWLDK